MFYRLSKKRLRISRGTLCVLALILIATLLRFILIYFNWPVTNSDEGNMGILARHVAYNGEWPIFFYGLPYLGPLEGYIAAPLFHLFGPSTFTLRLGLLPFFPLFVICMYYLTRLLYTHKLAVFTVLLLCFGSVEIIARQLKAVGEYPETLFFAAFISFVIFWLVLSYHSVSEQVRTTPRRIFIYGILGLVVGVALWVDFLILPFLGTGIVLLLLFCRRELRSWAAMSLLLGIGIGAFPLIYYNLTAPIQDNSISVLFSIDRSGSQLHLPFLQQIIGTLMIGLPNATGFNPLCSPQSFPFFGTPNTSCIVLQGGWALGYLTLWVVATLIVARVLWQGRKGSLLVNPDWSFEERQSMLRQYCRLMLLVSAGGTILLYAISPAAAAFPAPTARYLECVLVALPAILWPLWHGLREWRVPATWRARTSLLARGCLLALILFMFVMGTYTTFTQIPTAQTAYTQQKLLVQDLLNLGATRIYSEYWTCNRLIFQSEEQIICSSLDEHLNPGFDRYAPYQSIVRATTHPAYVFPQGSQQAAILDARIRNDRQFSTVFRRLTFEGYVIYLPKS